MKKWEITHIEKLFAEEGETVAIQWYNSTQ